MSQHQAALRMCERTRRDARLENLKYCALCQCVLSGKNRTKEHIIPNSIGGRKKTTGFICRTCNSKHGASWDAELARQLNWFSLALGISRESGTPPPRQLVQTVEGEKYWLLADGSFQPEKPSYVEEESAGTIRISLTANSLSEATSRLRGVARKYPGFDLEKAIRELQVKTEYMDSPLHVSLSLGGPDAGRSIIKTAYAFASECGVPHEDCEKALSFLQDENQPIPYGFAYMSDLVIDRPKDNVFHCVSLHGDPATKRLWSYVEYFSFFRYVVILSDCYSGPSVNAVYSINPVAGLPGGVRLNTSISQDELSLLVSGQGFNHENQRAAAEHVIPIVLARGRMRAWERIVDEGLDHACRQLEIRKDGVISQEMAAEFTTYMMEKISPYLERLVRGSRRRQPSELM
ncbi:HNH endonuclease [Uliginosibacterium sp. H1]|uniref:HNH endonuclease n=1 Tax=Uliginosibacterium sp. H1 TaxID=3114757 RepID=UPI002E175E3E|nr:HNH endonuclease [Uliginosibacterium sp. H1]